MHDLAGKTAFVTGGASGIGRALGGAFAEAGMRVMLADIDTGALRETVSGFDRLGFEVSGVECDVADPASVDRAAAAAFARFGRIHVLCNNAGVAGGSGIDNISRDTWRWIVDVNLMGVVHGVAAFLPHIRGHGEGGHIVNVASMAGLNSGLGFSPYSATKFAVVNMSEGLAREVGPLGVGVTVVCPGWVRTRISESSRHRPLRYGPMPQPGSGTPAARLAAQSAELSRQGMDPSAVAALTLAAVRDNQLYVFTHSDGSWRTEVAERFDAILSAMDHASGR